MRSSTRERRQRALFIGPGSPWENGYAESFNGKLRDEMLNGAYLPRKRWGSTGPVRYAERPAVRFRPSAQNSTPKLTP